LALNLLQTPLAATAAPAAADPPLGPLTSPSSTPTADAGTLETSMQVETTQPGLEEATLTPTFDVPAVLYYAQSGDSVSAVAARFAIDRGEVRSEVPLPESGFVPPGTLLIMPDRISEPTSPKNQIIPDSEMVFSGTAADFDIGAYIRGAGGKLSTHREYLGSTGWTTGAQAITRLAFENSINPRLLLALLEYESRWVRGDAVDAVHRDYPMGYINLYYKGLFGQMLWAVNQLSTGYYGWRAGTLTHLEFPDGSTVRINPQLNAGTAAIQYLFSKQHSRSQWAQMIDPSNGFLAVYTDMFGDPWARADKIEPLLPQGLVQPNLVLPFAPDIGWSYTGGPHGAWEHDGALAAIDFAPFTDHGGCDTTPTWVTAAASGTIVRSERGIVVQDLDGDGYEQTGWALVYLHIATQGRVPAGSYVQRDDRIGHASCEGGQATGTHLHFARKYNGEWIAADGPIPFVLSGWTVRQGNAPYEGLLTKGEKVITADPVGQLKSVIIRALDDE
jgi:LasA protease